MLKNWGEIMIICEIGASSWYFLVVIFFSFKDSFVPQGDIRLGITENNLQI